MKYLVVSADSKETLEEKVNALLNEGWQCQGGVSTQIIKNTAIFLQAVVFLKNI